MNHDNKYILKEQLIIKEKINNLLKNFINGIKPL
jgi:hypothetical protein